MLRMCVISLLLFSSFGCKTKASKEPNSASKKTGTKAQPMGQETPSPAQPTPPEAPASGDPGHEELGKRALAFLAKKNTDGFVGALLFSETDARTMMEQGLAVCPERADGMSVDESAKAFAKMLADSVAPAREEFERCANLHDFSSATFVRVEPRSAETVCGIDALDSLGVVLKIGEEEKEYFRVDDAALIEGEWKTPEGLLCTE